MAQLANQSNSGIKIFAFLCEWCQCLRGRENERSTGKSHIVGLENWFEEMKASQETICRQWGIQVKHIDKEAEWNNQPKRRRHGKGCAQQWVNMKMSKRLRTLNNSFWDLGMRKRKVKGLEGDVSKNNRNKSRRKFQEGISDQDFLIPQTPLFGFLQKGTIGYLWESLWYNVSIMRTVAEGR